MDNKRIIYSTRENIKSTLVIFLKYKKSVLWVNFFVALLTLLTQFAATYLPGWIVDLLTGENVGTQIWTRVLPVVALIGISELVIEVLNRKRRSRTRLSARKPPWISTAFRLGQDTG